MGSGQSVGSRAKVGDTHLGRRALSGLEEHVYDYSGLVF